MRRTGEQLVWRRVGGAHEPDAVVVQLVHQRDEPPRLVPRLREDTRSHCLCSNIETKWGRALHAVETAARTGIGLNETVPDATGQADGGAR